MNTNIIPVTICLPPSIFYFISFCYYKLYIIKNNQLYCSFKTNKFQICNETQNNLYNDCCTNYDQSK